MPGQFPLQWLDRRGAGLLLHPTSLPSPHGIGVLGPAACAFIDFLAEAGICYWQMLPLGPTGYGDSPYSAFSAFAGNIYLIDLEPLVENRLLKDGELEALSRLSSERVNYEALFKIKLPLLRLAHKRFVEQKRAYLPNYGMLTDFQKAQAGWLESYCAYIALKERFGGAFWGEWPEQCRTLTGARTSAFWRETQQGREAHTFFQYLFYGQWKQIRAHAAERGVEIIGDAPIFVALDSADVWAHPQLFEMSKPGQPDFVAGVPPDYFSETGQLWGNPLYDWKAMKVDGYAWWIDRLKSNFELFDIVRLDHFRGFHDYWRIPAGSKDARSGKWTKGPDDALFEAIAKAIPGARIIAEDLGEIHDGVRGLRDRMGLPGMAILHFAFGGGADNLYLPHNLVPNQVVYPGTHDNNTSRGWYEAASSTEQDHVRRYFRVSGQDIAWDMIRWAYQSNANLAIVAMQDLLSLGAEARMNVPGAALGNWQWRLTPQTFQQARTSAPYLRDLAGVYGR